MCKPVVESTRHSLGRAAPWAIAPCSNQPFSLFSNRVVKLSSISLSMPHIQMDIGVNFYMEIIIRTPLRNCTTHCTEA